jgi:hypothetical protein
VIQGPVIAPTPPAGIDLTYLFHQIVPILGFVVVVGVLALAARWIFGSAVGEAVAERIRHGSRRRRHWRGLGAEWSDSPEAPGEAGRVAALEEQVNLLTTQVSELAERLDFAERMLAERRERTLGAGGPHGNL